MGMRNTWRRQKQGCQRSVCKRVVNVIDELCQLMFDDEQILVLIHQATMLEHNPQFHYIKDPKEGQVEQILNEMEIQRDPKKRNGRGLIFGLLFVILLSGGILKCNIIKKNNFLYGLNNRNTIFEGLIDQVPVRMRMYSAFWMVDSDYIGIINGRVRLCKTTDNEIKITAISNKTNY